MFGRRERGREGEGEGEGERERVREVFLSGMREGRVRQNIKGILWF